MTNKELVTKAMTELFINGDLTAPNKYWGENYIQHNPYIANGLGEVKSLFEKANPGFKYELGLVVEDGEFVMVHGRYTGLMANPMIAVDIFRVKDGKLAEHWDVLQEEVPAETTVSKNAMFPAK